jgi:transcriptional regulator with XRE-family HTH domain
MSRVVTDVDQRVGRRIKERRLALGLSQERLSERVGVTHQQLQRYEYGLIRMSVYRLVAISKAVDVSPAYFLDGVSP